MSKKEITDSTLTKGAESQDSGVVNPNSQIEESNDSAVAEETEIENAMTEIEALQNRIVQYGNKAFAFVAETDLELVNVEFGYLTPIATKSKDIKLAYWEGNLYLQINKETYRLTDLS